MEMKHLVKWLCTALVLLLMITGASAEAELKTVFQYMPAIQSVPGTHCLIIESKSDNSRGLYTTDGTVLIPYGYHSIDYLSNGFFSAYDDKEALNGRQLWSIDGRMIGTANYTSFKVYSNHWVAAFVIRPEVVADSEKDTVFASKPYQYEHIDLFYVTDNMGESIEPVASLDRNAFAEAAIHGDYIAITNREKAVSVYDSSFQPVSIELTAANKPFYQVNKYQIVSLLNHLVIGDGYTEVAEANLGDRMLVRATRVALDGTKLTCLMKPDGTVLLPPEYELIDLTDHYAVVADLEKRQGLFSLDEGRMIVPCAYSAIVSSSTDVDKYVHNGYVCVEKEEKLGFYDVANDRESCAPKYSRRAVTNIGCCLVFTTIDGDLTIVAGDGAVSTVDADEILTTRGSGYLLEAKKGASFGLVDWHGNIILPIDHYKDIIVTDDTQAIIRTGTGMQLDQVIR